MVIRCKGGDQVVVKVEEMLSVVQRRICQTRAHKYPTKMDAKVTGFDQRWLEIHPSTGGWYGHSAKHLREP